MVKFKIVKPFVMEMLVFLFVFVVVTIGLLTGNYIEITINPNFITISLIVILIALFLGLFSRVVNIGFRALFDFVFQRSKTYNCLFINELPYRASVFSEKFNKNNELSYGMYYLIHMKNDEETLTFVSPVYLGLDAGKRYTFRIASSSHIVLDWSDCSNIESV